MNLKQLEDPQNDIIDIAEARCLGLLGMVQPTGPIESHIGITSVKLDGGTNGTPSGCLAEGEEAVEYRAVLANVETLELTQKGGIGVGLLRGHGGEEGDVVLRMEASDIVWGSGEGSEDLEASMEVVVDNKVVSHADAVGLHRVALAIVVIANGRLVEVTDAAFTGVRA